MTRGQTIGYARTSTVDQEAGFAAQIRDLEAAGCQRIYREQTSAKEGNERRELDAALSFLQEGDTLVVTKLDRLARSVADLVSITSRLNGKGVGLRILGMNLDTSTPEGKLMVNLLGSIAAFERDLMLERQREGIAKAKKDGKYKGRAPTAQSKAAEIVRLRDEGKSAGEIMKATGAGRSSVFRILKEAGKTGVRTSASSAV